MEENDAGVARRGERRRAASIEQARFGERVGSGAVASDDRRAPVGAPRASVARVDERGVAEVAGRGRHRTVRHHADRDKAAWIARMAYLDRLRLLAEDTQIAAGV